MFGYVWVSHLNSSEFQYIPMLYDVIVMFKQQREWAISSFLDAPFWGQTPHLEVSSAHFPAHFQDLTS